MWTSERARPPLDWARAMEARAVDPGLLVLAEGLASFAGPQDPESLQRTILVCLLVLAA